MTLLENCIRNISIYLQQMNLIKCPPRRQHEHWLDSGDCQLFYKLSHEDISVSLGSLGNTSPKEYQNMRLQTSLVVQWLRFCTSTAGGRASNPGRGTKILHAMWWEWKKNVSVHHKLSGALIKEIISWGCKLMEASPSAVALVVVAGGRACTNSCTNYCEWKMLPHISVNKGCYSHPAITLYLPPMVHPEGIQNGKGCPPTSPQLLKSLIPQN